MHNVVRKIGLVLLVSLFANISFISSSFADSSSSVSTSSVFATQAPGTVSPTDSVAGPTQQNTNTTTGATTATATANAQPVSQPLPQAMPMPTVTPVLNPIPPALNVHGYYLMDVNSGAVIATLNPNQHMAPASLTKLMTLYLTFEALQAGRIHLNDPVLISKKAWSTGGSRMFLTPGSSVTVEQLIKGIVVDSGNDACVALSQYVGGTGANFVNLMNQQAALLDMANTHYVDCTGLPNPDHYTTPRDIATLTRAMMVNFPQYYHFFALKELTYDNITQPNRNGLLWSDPSVDGLKTGYTSEAGYCLVSSAVRSNVRLLSVLLGAPSSHDRDAYSEALLNYGYRFYNTHKIYSADQPITNVRVWYSTNGNIPVGLANDFYVTVVRGQFAKATIQKNINPYLVAPLAKGAVVGNINVVLDKKVIASANIVALTAAPSGGVWTDFIDHIELFFKRFF